MGTLTKNICVCVLLDIQEKNAKEVKREQCNPSILFRILLFHLKELNCFLDRNTYDMAFGSHGFMLIHLNFVSFVIVSVPGFRCSQH